MGEIAQVSEKQVRWFRLRRSGLVEPFDSPESAARALAGIQAQVLPAAGIALWNRTSGSSYGAFERLLYEKRSLVKLWGQRGTLHVYASEDWPLVCAALGGRLTHWERRIKREGGDVRAYEAVVAQVAGVLRQRGTLGRDHLRAAKRDLEAFFSTLEGDHGQEELSSLIFSSWGGVFAALVRRGLACHARPEGSKGRFAHREAWLPDLAWDPPPAEQANLELARRYLAAYGPANAADLAYWHGAPVGDARRWIAGLGQEVAEIQVDGQSMLALRADLGTLQEEPPAREDWPVRLLFRFDPLLLGLRDKGWIVENESYGRVWKPAGDIEGTLLEYGRIAGTWGYQRREKNLAVSGQAFAPLDPSVRSTVEERAQGIAEFLGLKLAELHIKEP